ncbi:DeoR faimly transcriptional regulator [Bacillus manliponensis]|uniref:DeoR faimly transcriptional regulator n=1 Tax=Bacillus manliponensis TaxID=574376 RepID=A0A073K2I4_9BACI|nr:dienelactone hydrolase family protein [Bacillus manliponensis]KEK20672.1 DeoR faimly transcriptional regulator [Bacillus manliponensis]
MSPKIALIAVHEIYGVNDYMNDVIQTFSSQQIDVFCPNLLQRTHPFSYEEEQQAYSYFMKHVGFDVGKEKIETIVTELKKEYTYVGIVGFNVGATIAWRCSKNTEVNFVICCYGSRIRDYIDVKPACPALLLFPKEETSFSVTSLVTYLNENNPSLHIQQFQGEHGFLNRFNKTYHEQSAKDATIIIQSFLHHIF